MFSKGLSKTDIKDAKNLPAFLICPQEGELIVYKKLAGGVIAKLLIPADARRVNCIGSRKCRAEKVIVLGLSEGEECF